MTLLGRIIRWKDWGIEYEADPKQRKLICEQFGFDGGTRSLQTNGGAEAEEGDEEYLGSEEARTYRATAARVNYLSQDTPDLMFGTKEGCRGMANPTRGDWRKLKRIARYLCGREAVRWKYVWQDEGARMKVFTDSDWAGCRKTRKSSSGGLIMVGSHCLRAWCSTQGALALSSAEAEYYSMVEGVLRARGLQNIGREIRMPGSEEGVQLYLWVDSSAAKSFVSKRGAGKMRHMEVRWLWLQEEVRRGRVKVEKVWGPWNPADLMTKYLTGKEVDERSERMCLEADRRG